MGIGAVEEVHTQSPGSTRLAQGYPADEMGLLPGCVLGTGDCCLYQEGQGQVGEASVGCVAGCVSAQRTWGWGEQRPGHGARDARSRV